MSVLQDQLEDLRALMIANAERDVEFFDTVTQGMRNMDAVRSQHFASIARVVNEYLAPPKPLYEPTAAVQSPQQAVPQGYPSGPQVPQRVQQGSNGGPYGSPPAAAVAAPTPAGYSAPFDPYLAQSYGQPARTQPPPPPPPTHPGDISRIVAGLEAAEQERRQRRG